MSITPYNKYRVRDLSGNKQPYVSSSIEFGYFGGVTNNYGNNWYSLPVFLNTNNGIASLDASCGLRILSAGIYTITLGLDFFTSGSKNNNALSVYFCLGNVYLRGQALSGSFGGSHTTGMFSFGSNAITYPGIISWITNSISIGVASANNYIANNQLIYNYYTKTDGGGTFGQGICTTEIKFIINQPTTIYLNTMTSSTLAMGKSYFTLDLISNVSPNNFGWTQQTASGSRNWQTIASSSDGSKLAAVVSGGYIYTSTNSGVSWSQSATSKNWLSIASSSDGTKLVAGTNGQGIYTNASSGSGNWTLTSAINTTAKWTSIASDSTGQYLATVSNNGYGLYTNANFGIGNWAQQTLGLPPAGSTNWSSIASDSTGQYLAAVVDTGTIYTNSNYGNGTWSARTNGVSASNGLPATAKWYSIASSSDGSMLAAVVYGGGIYTSTDYGGTWSQQTLGLPTTANWQTIASSSDGSKLAALVDGVGIWRSTNSGVSWSQQTLGLPATANWQAIASSSDGSNLVAVVYGGTIYTGTVTYLI